MQGLSAGSDHYFLTLPGYHKWGQWGEFPPLECDMSILVETAPEAQRKGQRLWSWSSGWRKSLLNLLLPTFSVAIQNSLVGGPILQNVLGTVTSVNQGLLGAGGLLGGGGLLSYGGIFSLVEELSG